MVIEMVVIEDVAHVNLANISGMKAVKDEDVNVSASPEEEHEGEWRQLRHDVKISLTTFDREKVDREPHLLPR